jgi:hypothetical protein
MAILAVVALIAATLFAGAALYISLVEHPARLGLDDGPLLAQWAPSYARALPLQAGLAIIGGVAGLLAWYGLDNWRWMAGSIVLLANWPFTLLVIMPVNKRLQVMRPDQAGAESRRLLRRWGGLHNIRSGLGAVAMALFAWGMLAALSR